MRIRLWNLLLSFPLFSLSHNNRRRRPRGPVQRSRFSPAWSARRRPPPPCPSTVSAPASSSRRRNWTAVNLRNSCWTPSLSKSQTFSAWRPAGGWTMGKVCGVDGNWMCFRFWNCDCYYRLLLWLGVYKAYILRLHHVLVCMFCI